MIFRRHRTLIIIIATLSALVFFLGCKSSAKKKSNADSDEAPDWVYETPMEKGKIFAVGVAGVTYYRSDAMKFAAENARNELSRTLHVRINSVMVEWTTERGSYIDQASVQQVASWATDVAMSGSSIVAFWYDEKGRAGPPGFTYCLAVLSLDPEIVNYSATAQEKIDPESSESVRENAKKLFEDLSEMEEKAGN